MGSQTSDLPEDLNTAQERWVEFPKVEVCPVLSAFQPPSLKVFCGVLTLRRPVRPAPFSSLPPGYLSAGCWNTPTKLRNAQGASKQT